MDVFRFRDRLVDTYQSYASSFVPILAEDIRKQVDAAFAAGDFWPQPLIQLNPAFEPGEWIDELVERGDLHATSAQVFRRKSVENPYGVRLRPHRHQVDAIRASKTGRSYVLTTGTGSGKSLAYVIPIVDAVLRRGSGRGIRAIIVYPMNALVNSQLGELEKFLNLGFPQQHGPVTFRAYTGQNLEEDRQAIRESPPDILLTNYVMLELLLTRPEDQSVIDAARGLQFLVLDELHTYRGRQGADVAILVRRIRDRLDAPDMQCIGTSATLAGEGTHAEKQAQVAAIASVLFGTEVLPEHVIGETLRRATPELELDDPNTLARLRERIAAPDALDRMETPEFVNDALASWVESTFGVTREPASGRLIRSTPVSIHGADGAGQRLSQATGLPVADCSIAIQRCLLAGYRCRQADTGFPVFAFRLHQFISRGDTVYASLEPPGTRHVTLEGQQFVPGDRQRLLLPLVFCRECGQEYASVFQSTTDDGRQRYAARDYLERGDDEGKRGYLYTSSAAPWPGEAAALAEARIPDSWVEDTGTYQRVRTNYRKYLPQPVRLLPRGEEATAADDGLDCAFIPAPFRFCLNCGVEYAGRGGDDFGKLATLGSEGRSTATTILTLDAVRALREDGSLDPHARKVLSFTDNRQDASLQAGHFNDFVEVGLIRGALYRAVEAAGSQGIGHEELTQRVAEATGLTVRDYASDPDVRYQNKFETERAFREVLGYRIYRDLRRGWRITLPNLEQCGLLEIRYLSLDEACGDDDLWQNMHPALVTASPETRVAIAHTLLDEMRRGLAVSARYLDRLGQEQIQTNSNQRLIDPWRIPDEEKMLPGTLLIPRARQQTDLRDEYMYLSARGGYGQYLRRPATFPELSQQLPLADTNQIIRELLEALREAGIVERVREPEGPDDAPGYQVRSAAMRWHAGDGTRPLHDPIRVPRLSAGGGQTNQFFITYYRETAQHLHGISAKEHTAQVRYEDRQQREQDFTTARLPVLFCSPTMELGVDIAELNTVNMRNVPPTPANYAQRSGRAGRSGQPALVFTYSAVGSSHDQYFFKRPELMVSGQVTPPRLDLTNRALLESHLHAIWLSETRQKLGRSLADVLDLTGDPPTLDLRDEVRHGLESATALLQARTRAERVLQSVLPMLTESDWYSDAWFDGVFASVVRDFEQATERWRSLYRAALNQQQAQNRIANDYSRPSHERDQARRLRREAEAQLDLLRDTDNLLQSDFYSYRYFASEGFLPGYSFPRLPLSAFIPSRRGRGSEEFIQRPRFLAISEFAPRAIIYHDGSRYEIVRANLPVGDDRPSTSSDESVATLSIRLCPACGYLHQLTPDRSPDVCDWCAAPLSPQLERLFRQQNVTTRRRERISSDEEERMRVGYEIVAGVRFADRDGQPSFRSAGIQGGEQSLGRLAYGDAATIWRINLGLRRRKFPNRYGFVIDVDTGNWQRAESLAASDDQPDDTPQAQRTTRVIPFVEDARNALLIEPAQTLSQKHLLSLLFALKHAIQQEYQLEDSELATEALPTGQSPSRILLYESAEGGAGVLRRLLIEPQALAGVARRALDICHFDPLTGEDRRRSRFSRDDCEAACYDCLLTYSNQREHDNLDRQLIHELLLDLSRATVIPDGSEDRLAHLLRLAGSELEREWLRYLRRRGLRLPDHAQRLIASAGTRPDFTYADDYVAVYIDGPYHDYPERQTQDRQITTALENDGYVVIRFGAHDDWDAIIQQYPHIFGRGSR